MTATALESAFGIGPDDTAANRTGRLGPGQARNLLRSGWNNVAGAVVVGILLALILAFVANKPLKPVQVGVSLLLFGAVLAVGVRWLQRMRGAVADGTVECLAGPVTVESRGRDGFWLTVAGREFRMPIRPWHVKSGAAYRVYVAPRISVIVGMEEAG